MNTQIQQRSLALLWNASSGWSDSDGEREIVRSILGADGSHVDVFQVERGADIVERIRDATRTGVDVVVIAGGDGTVNAAASVLAHQETALGVIPAGTLNHFARDLKLPLDPEEAARTLVTASMANIDAAAVNDRVFVNNAVLGFFPEYSEYRERLDARGCGSSRIGRFIATIVALGITLWRLPRLTVSFPVEGRTRTLRTPFVLVGNNEHRMEGLALGQRHRLDSGLLWVYVLRPHSRWRLFWFSMGLLAGKTSRESLFEIFATPQLTIDTRRRHIGVGVDGEMVRMSGPLRFKSLPGALRVLTA